MDEKSHAIKQLEDELHVRGVGGVEERAEVLRAGMERGASRIRRGASQRQGSYHDQGKEIAASGHVKVGTWREGSGGQETEGHARRPRRTLPRASPHALSSGKQMLNGLARLRSELQGVTAQASSNRGCFSWSPRIWCEHGSFS